MRRVGNLFHPVAVAGALAAATICAALARAQERSGGEPTLSDWARPRAVRIPAASQEYVESDYNFLQSLLGNARVASFGEQHHCGHEPLEFRNNLIRYAVTRLGFTAVMVESGLTEAGVIDRYIQGGPGKLDSVVRVGLTWQFGGLPENRELVAWMRSYNRTAQRKIHFYGLDVSGANDTIPEVYDYAAAPQAVLVALDYLHTTAPATGKTLSEQLKPLLDRFSVSGYRRLSEAERKRLRENLEQLYGVVLANTTRDRDSDALASHAWVLRNAWMALQLLDIVSGKNGPVVSPRNGVLRDSIMAENAAWVLDQVGPGGRVVLFAHNGHVLNAPLLLPSFSKEPIPMMGQRLRRRLGSSMVVIGSTTASTVGFGPNPNDASSLDAALKPVGLPNFLVDLRRSDSMPSVAAQLNKPWPFRFVGGFLAKNPRESMDAIVYFEHVTATPTPHAGIACNG